MFEVVLFDTRYLPRYVEAIKAVEVFFENKVKKLATVIDELHKDENSIRFSVHFNHSLTLQGHIDFKIYFPKNAFVYIQGSFDNNTKEIHNILLKSEQTYQDNWSEYFDNFFLGKHRILTIYLDELEKYGNEMNFAINTLDIKSDKGYTSVNGSYEIKEEYSSLEFKNNLKPTCYTSFTSKNNKDSSYDIIQNIHVFRSLYAIIYNYETSVDKIFENVTGDYFETIF